MDHARFVQTLRKARCMLPPLTGYTDYPYRVVLSRFSPAFLTTEMVHASAVVRRNARTMQMLRQVEGSHANGVQLLGRKSQDMVEAAKFLDGQGFDYIDINMGCTVPKVIRRGEGVALMKDEEFAASLLASLVQAVDIPVTVKLRLGPSLSSQNYLSLARRLQETGVAAVTIHGRTGEHKSSPSVDREGIALAVGSLSVPVIANGGISSGIVGSLVLRETGCAGVMPGRFLIGNPWLVADLQAAVAGKEFVAPVFEERVEVCRLHFDLLVESYGARTAAVRMRSLFSHYFPAVRGRAAFNRDVRLMGYGDFRRLLETIEDVSWDSQPGAGLSGY
jgi:tRNA-dihydrouridine synthase B